MRASSAMVDVLSAAGVARAYTVPGESFLGLLDTIEYDSEIQLVSTRHESGAAFMAEGDAKLTGRPAVVMATRGVGASNLTIGVHTAYQDSTPMVVLLGQVETDFLGREAFQEVDLDKFFDPIAKWAVTAGRGDRLPELTAQALQVATSGRPGPVVIAVPSDLLLEEPSSEAVSHAVAAVRNRVRPSTLSADVVSQISKLLAEAKQPVVVAGGGTRGARAELVEFAERFQVGVYTAFRRQDHFPNDHPHYLGHLGLGNPGSCIDALATADLVLVLGSRLSETTTQSYTMPPAGAKVIQIDIDPRSIGAVASPVVGAVSDAGEALRALLRQQVDALPTRDWSAGHAAYLQWSTAGETVPSEGTVDPTAAITAMQAVAPAETIVANDAGNFSAFLHRYWRYGLPATQLAPTSGAMGYAVPAAIGGALACPERPMLAVAGDGSFLMTGQEIETAVRLGVPLTVVVLNNRMYGTIAMHQAVTSQRTAGTTIGDVDVAGFARSLGANGTRVHSTDALESALSDALRSQSVDLIEVMTDPDCIAPGRRMSDLLAGRQ